ncbi:CGP-CTERM sorting domain-containing protein, partial [Thermococcus alcaliphilus]|nr:CGP-CTERM sorting domain-containing protein [Thermococcus alcaliphilus]
FFNPFACRDIRYALNFLISRQYIVQNILQGSGQPMLGGIRPSTGANAYFEPVYKAMGITAVADIAKSQQLVENCMKKAADELAKQGYELKKGDDGFWYFNGEPVTLKFIIRIEDHRKDLGLYVADLIERFWGFKVERLLWDRR